MRKIRERERIFFLLFLLRGKKKSRRTVCWATILTPTTPPLSPLTTRSLQKLPIPEILKQLTTKESRKQQQQRALAKKKNTNLAIFFPSSPPPFGPTPPPSPHFPSLFPFPTLVPPPPFFPFPHPSSTSSVNRKKEKKSKA